MTTHGRWRQLYRVSFRQFVFWLTLFGALIRAYQPDAPWQILETAAFFLMMSERQSTRFADTATALFVGYGTAFAIIFGFGLLGVPVRN